MSQISQPKVGRAAALMTINLPALRGNYRTLKNLLGTVPCGAAVKADAYGLGALEVTAALIDEGCRHFFVAHLEEAISLREGLARKHSDAHLSANLVNNLTVSANNDVNKVVNNTPRINTASHHQDSDISIYVMHGSPIGYEKDFLEYACTPVLNSLDQIAAWRHLAHNTNQTLAAIIQVDTGMARMGLSDSEVQAWLAQPQLLDGIDVTYVMSHLACAENQQNPMNQRQLQKMTLLLQQLPHTYKASLANSSGIFLGKEFHFDLARPGAALYGIAPVAGQENPLQAVVQLQAKIIQIREISVGTTVGYSATWSAEKTTRIATVAVGYADGWLRSLSNRGVAMIAGYEAPMVGNVSMDTITFDVTHIPTHCLAEGVLVDLLTETFTADDVAEKAKTIGYEILTSMGTRYQRHYVE